MTDEAATELVQGWLARLDAALSAGDVAAATALVGSHWGSAVTPWPLQSRCH